MLYHACSGLSSAGGVKCCGSKEQFWAFWRPPFWQDYLIFFVAYALPRFNLDDNLGDISYGMYIYAWPVQQVVAHYFTSIGPYKATLISTVIVSALAWLSWHYLEKPALGLKSRLLRRSG